MSKTLTGNSVLKHQLIWIFLVTSAVLRDVFNDQLISFVLNRNFVCVTQDHYKQIHSY